VPTRTGENCWLMANLGSGTEKKRGRLLGTKSTVAPIPFSPTALSIVLLNGSSPSTEWHAGDVARSNLGGTISSWNEVDPASMASGGVQPGLLSRDGWSLVVDNAPLVEGKNASDSAGTATARFLPPARAAPTEYAATPAPWVDGSPWIAYPEEVGAAAAPFDAYFFGCGLQFTECLHDWSVLSGAVPLPPRQTVGVWWSKYDVFSAATIESTVLAEFASRSLPLDVLQMDVDWHFRNPAQKSTCAGYNGYDWNASLFPDPSAFVSTVRRGNWSNGGPQRALKLLLNTHSFEGLDPCSNEFAAAAAAVGHTNLSRPIQWNVTSREVMGVLFDAVLAFNASAPAVRGSRPDYWWTDGAIVKWTGNAMGGGGGGQHSNVGTGAFLSDAGNLMWNVHLHDGWIRGASPEEHGNRPMVMPRFAGLGQHRYCCGFSGDADATFVTLSAEVNMTKMAANIGFAHWSHDVGGFRGDPTDEEYVRWTQAAALWPIYRSHGKKGTERRYWAYPSYAIMKESLILRTVISPYVYTSAWAAHMSGVGAVHSMYIDHPTENDAFGPVCDLQFMHGADLIVRPVVETLNGTAGGRVTVPLWLPPSKYGWAEWNSSAVAEATKGGYSAHVSVSAALRDLPMFARIGAALPTLPLDSLSVMRNDSLVWTLIGSGRATRAKDRVATAIDGSGVLYIDDGDTTEYENGTYATQALGWRYESAPSASLSVNIGAAVSNGGFKVSSVKRTVAIDLRGVGGGALPLPSKDATCTASATHQLARPIGTVTCVLNAQLASTESFSFVLSW